MFFTLYSVIFKVKLSNIIARVCKVKKLFLPFEAAAPISQIVQEITFSPVLPHKPNNCYTLT